ncbi:molybdenum cofactor guanylyltransferase [Dokdonella sp.]|uniref:molybdenum cofactor guanylyltransferase n=1 Tax=Dokdonella sp. TaxID=2291710 RepID=UPI0025C1150C|nr:molybdenum cofactor guanylyltransferase [Dokdonella sp.]
MTSRKRMTDTRTESPWNGVVLAGGRSTRMGRDKALLDWQGRPMVEHMGGVLREAGAQGVVVSGDYPAFDGIADEKGGLGPLGGLGSVAAHLADGVLVLVPVDMPLLDVALLRSLAQTDADCVCFVDHVLPLRLRLHDRSRAWLRQALELPPAQRSLRALHAALGGMQLPLADAQRARLINCNTPEQWQEHGR